MAFTYDHLMSYRVCDAEQELTVKDCMLYALGVGFGTEPLDPGHLRYVYEDGIAALPTMANVLATPGFWWAEPETGVDWPKALHGEQAFTIHRTLPVEGTLVGRTRVRGINDKGPEKGAFVYVEREVLDKASGERICTLEQTNVLRGDGGCGGSDPAPRPPHQLPEREPDHACDLAVPESAALVYRLSGDYNPLHADPAVAKAAGFERPILHGLCTFGYAGHAILKTVCGYDDRRIRHMALRFTAPVYPGETLRTEMWEEDGGVSFRTLALERGVVVLGNGWTEIS